MRIGKDTKILEEREIEIGGEKVVIRLISYYIREHKVFRIIGSFIEKDIVVSNLNQRLDSKFKEDAQITKEMEK